MERITKEELLEMLFHDDYEHLKGKKLRMTRVRVPGKGSLSCPCDQSFPILYL